MYRPDPIGGRLNLFPLMHEIALLSLALLILFLDLLDLKPKKALGYLSLLGLITVALLDVKLMGLNYTLFGGMYILDSLSLFFKGTFLLITFLVIIFSLDYFDKFSQKGEYYVILLFILLGMSLLVSAGELITIFISLELISLPLYILVAFHRKQKTSAEAGLKYFLLGVFSSAILLYGMSLIYGTFGTTFLNEIFDKLKTLPAYDSALVLGILMVLAGFAFKIAAVPFHFWAPDVYQGAPTPVTAFISTAPKAAVVCILIRFLQGYLPIISSYWILIIALLAVFSMTIGNLAALVQNNIKRLLAYSGIAQMGYILVGLTAMPGAIYLAKATTPDEVNLAVLGISSVLFYIFIYVLMNLAAFGVVIVVSLATGSDDLEAFSGLAKRSPGLALILLLSFLSLAGIPPLAGFIGKFYLFIAAFNKGMIGLVIIAIINCVISLYYYLRVLKYVYLEKPAELLPVKVSFLTQIALVTAVLGFVFLGLYPYFFDILQRISRSFMLG